MADSSPENWGKRRLQPALKRFRGEMGIVAPPLSSNQPVTHLRALLQLADTLGQQGGRRCLPNEAAFAQRVRDGTAGVGYDRDTEVHGLDEGDAEAFVLAGAQE